MQDVGTETTCETRGRGTGRALDSNRPAPVTALGGPKGRAWSGCDLLELPDSAPEPVPHYVGNTVGEPLFRLVPHTGQFLLENEVVRGPT